MVFRPKLPEGWLSLFLLMCVVEVTVASVVRAAWVDGLDILTWIALIAIGWGLVFSRLRVPAIFLHVAAIIVGFGVDFYLVASTLPDGSLEGRLVEISDRLLNWLTLVTNGDVANDNLLFLLFLSGIVWIIGYYGTWAVFRLHNAWWVSFAAGTGLIVNISYAPKLETYFFIFLMCAILLIVRLNIYKQESAWQRDRVSFHAEIGWGLVRNSAWISVVVVIAAWLTPSTILASQTVSDALSPVIRPWDDVQSEFSRLFGGVRPNSESSASGFGKTLALKTGVKLGGEIVLQVSGIEPMRLRGVVYEKYTGQGWLAADRSEYRIAADDNHPSLAPEYEARKDITETITVVQPRSTVVFAPSMPRRINIPTTAEMEVPKPVTVDVATLEDGGTAPANLVAVVDELRERVASDKLSFPSKDADVSVPLPTVNALSNKLMSPFELTGLRMRDDQITSADLRPIDMDFSDVSVLRSPSMMRRGFRYTVVSSVSTADIALLRKAGDDYPDWLRHRYLALPRTVTRRTTVLAHQLALRQSNAYDAATAIENYLRQYAYSDVVDLPPSSRDAVDYFLFQGKEGYCDYFASAFAVLARSVGIPTRVVSGFAPGDADQSQGVTLVRDWHAHTWPEVYFPQYGWIEFEPTPSRPTISRPQSESTDNLDSLSATSGRTRLAEDYPNADELLMEAMGASGSADSRVATSSDGLPWLPIRVIVTLAGLAALIYLGYLSIWQRSLIGLRPAEVVYVKMCRLGTWLGVKRSPHLTPNEYGALLIKALPGERSRINQIVDAYVRQTFGRKRLDMRSQVNLAEAWRQVRNGLLKMRLNRR